MAHRERDLSPIEQRLRKRYRFICELGSGGMAAVHLARESDGRLIAVKMVRRTHERDPEAIARFAREARIVTALSHPNIVPTYGVERDGDREIAIIRAYVHGHTLREQLRGGTIFGYERARDVLRQLAEALRYSHAQGVVHRDVKPENIFIDERTGAALLGDFGIARDMTRGETEVTLGGTSVGTPAYMSPEQIDGVPVDARSDWYSLGVVGWEMLSGRRPWDGDGIYGTIYKQKREELPGLRSLRPDIPDPLRFAIEGALLKDRDLRWQNADEFLAQLLEGWDASAAASDDVADAVSATVQFDTPASGRPNHHLRAGDVDDWLYPDDDGVRVARPTSHTDRSRDAVTDSASLDASQPETPATELPPPLESRPERAVSAIRSMRGRERQLLAPAAVLLAFVLGAGGLAHDRTAKRNAEHATRTSSAAPVIVAHRDTSAARPRARGRDTSVSVTAASAGDVAHRARDTAATRATHVDTARRVLTPSRNRCESPATDDQRACLASLVATTDRPVNEAYRRLIANLRGRTGASSRQRDPAQVRALRTEQRRWLEYRAAECARRTHSADGTRWARDRAGCYAQLAKVRAGRLYQRLVTASR